MLDVAGSMQTCRLTPITVPRMRGPMELFIVHGSRSEEAMHDHYSSRAQTPGLRLGLLLVSRLSVRSRLPGSDAGREPGGICSP